MKDFRLSNDEWNELERKFGDLCKFAGWKVLRNNHKGTHTEDLDDVEQELKQAVLIAASHFKRQCFIESSLEKIRINTEDMIIRKIVDELDELWKARKTHKFVFGETQEKILLRLLERYAPEQRQINQEPIRVSEEFGRYCKAIVWNRQKTIMRKIGKEKWLRGGLIVFSQMDNDID